MDENGRRIRFTSAILPPYLQKSPSLEKFCPKTRWQRCWMHKTMNVLNNFPDSHKPAAKAKLQEIWMASTKAKAQEAMQRFVCDYQAKYPKAVECHKRRRGR